MQQMTDDRERQQAFMALLEPIQRMLERFCINMTGNRDEALDLMQDSIILAWNHFETIRDRGAFKSYIFTIATNTYRRKFVRAKFFGLYNDDLVETLASSTPSPEVQTDHEIVRKALLSLPAAYREALIHYEVNDMSVAEIQKIQGGTISGVKVRLMRARRKLAALVGVVLDSPERESANGAPSSTPLL